MATAKPQQDRDQASTAPIEGTSSVVQAPPRESALDALDGIANVVTLMALGVFLSGSWYSGETANLTAGSYLRVAGIGLIVLSALLKVFSFAPTWLAKKT